MSKKVKVVKVGWKAGDIGKDQGDNSKVGRDIQCCSKLDNCGGSYSYIRVLRY
jgi:hypothetical protein